MGFEAFAGHKYLNLETFKKSGEGVKTPVWFAPDPSVRLDSRDAKLYVYTLGVSGKVKRMRAFKSHILTKKTSKRKRRLRQGTIIQTPGETKNIKRLLQA